MSQSNDNAAPGSVKQLFDLAGRVALITGGSRGLGLAMATALGEMGAKVAITARKADELDAALAQLRGRGIQAESFVNDLSKHDTIEPLVAAVVGKLGPIDILINNAGTSWGAPAEEHPLEAWQKVVDLNLTGTFRITQEVGKRCMIPRKYGRIVNIASIAGLQGAHPEVLRAIAYQTTKGGLVNFTRALAAEWGRHHIVVNAICPGFILTQMSRVTLEKIAPLVKAGTPLRQLGEEQDLQGLVVMLSSAAARHITGQIIAVDGGASIV
ncbi:MAG TPA: SDR family oxidoreductase [Steroidobacteraceae bacterium]|jgi:gluconate 5-dehydrogenase|nr:SDR family oxidoreductase [Steroidobacteraceae bacterium]